MAMMMIVILTRLITIILLTVVTELMMLITLIIVITIILMMVITCTIILSLPGTMNLLIPVQLPTNQKVVQLSSWGTCIGILMKTLFVIHSMFVVLLHKFT